MNFRFNSFVEWVILVLWWPRQRLLLPVLLQGMVMWRVSVGVSVGCWRAGRDHVGWVVDRGLHEEEALPG